MAETVKQIEAMPDSYPEAMARFRRQNFIYGIDELPEKEQIWQRIEAYTAYRWTPRDVVWIVEGEGSWEPPLAPATVSAVEQWEGGDWVTTAPPTSALGGYNFPGDGPYRVTATVGGGELPSAVKKAFQRLFEYSRGMEDMFKNEAAYAGDQDGEVIRNWTGKAIQLSGAADLLRPYRRV